MSDPAGNVGRVKIGLGLSILAAAVAIGWFWYDGSPVTGLVLGALLTGGGYWEYRRKLDDIRAARRAEGEAERHREQRRK